MSTASPVPGVVCPPPVQPLGVQVEALDQLPLAFAVKVHTSVEEDVYRNGAGFAQALVFDAALIGFCPTR